MKKLFVILVLCGPSALFASSHSFFCDPEYLASLAVQEKNNTTATTTALVQSAQEHIQNSQITQQPQRPLRMSKSTPNLENPLYQRFTAASQSSSSSLQQLLQRPITPPPPSPHVQPNDMNTLVGLILDMQSSNPRLTDLTHLNNAKMLQAYIHAHKLYTYFLEECALELENKNDPESVSRMEELLKNFQLVMSFFKRPATTSKATLEQSARS